MEEFLRQIGFEEKEAKVYLTLLRIGNSPASKVAKETGYERTSTYYLLLRMIDKGYVGQHIKGEIKNFSATPPARLKDMLREKQEILEEALPQLEELQKFHQESSSVEVRVGKEGFKHLYRDAIAAGGEVLGLGVEDAQYAEFDRWSLQQYYRDAENRGMSERFITYEGAYQYGSAITIYRTVPKAYFQPTPTFIYGENVVIITWHPTPMLIFIKSKELASAYKKHFELLWKNSNSRIKNNKLINMAGIKDTAFWIAACRAEEEKLSKDIYAKHWLNDASKKIHDKYLEEVSKDENLALSLRNRFFLEELKQFASSHKDPAFINLGSGVSMYPFLLKQNMRFCEVDCKEIISFKRKKIKSLIKDKILPGRDITYFSTDLNNQVELDKLFRKLKKWVGNSPVFILLEGVLYYLDKVDIKKLISSCGDLQKQGNLLGIITWPRALKSAPVFKKFTNFVSKVLHEDSSNFVFLDLEDVIKFDTHTPLKHMNYLELSKKYKVNHKLKAKDDLIFEDLYILTKK